MLTLFDIVEPAAAEAPRCIAVEPPVFAAAEALSRPRTGALAVSLLLHYAGCAAAVLLSSFVAPPEPYPTLYERFIEPHRERIIWYTAAPRQIAVTAAAATFGRATAPEQRTRARVVSDAPHAPARRELIYHEAPRIQVEADLRAANVVVVRNAAPPPVERRFAAPAARFTAPGPATALPAGGPPVLGEAPVALVGAAPAHLGVPLRPRPFTAPARRTAGVPGGPHSLEPPPALAAVEGGGVAAVAGPPGIIGRRSRSFVPPPPEAVWGGTDPAGGESALALPGVVRAVSAAILSEQGGPNILLNVPEAVRPARFGSSPDRGPLQAGTEKGAVAAMRSVSAEGVTGSGAAPAPELALPVTRVVHPKDGRFNVVVLGGGALDVLPEARGQLTGKPVYTVYLAVGLRRKWTLQYCVPGSTGGVAGLEAPWPYTIARPDVPASMIADYVLVSGRITAEGRFSRARVLRPAGLPVASLLTAALEIWEFRPARIAGQPAEVEVLLTLPRPAE